MVFAPVWSGKGCHFHKESVVQKRFFKICSDTSVVSGSLLHRFQNERQAEYRLCCSQGMFGVFAVIHISSDLE